LEDGCVFIGPTEAEARPLKLKQLVFANSQDTSSVCWTHALSADGKLLAAPFEDDILVWRLSDGLLVQRLHYRGRAETVSSPSFSPLNDYTLVSGSEDNAAVVWDIRSGRPLVRLEGHSGPVTRVAYAPHGALIATCSHSDEFAKIWDTSTGVCIRSFSGGILMDKPFFSPDGSRLYVESYSSQSCLVYDIQTHTHVATLRHGDNAAIYWSTSRQGDRMASAPADPGQVHIWNTATGEDLLTINHPKMLSRPAAFSPDGVEILVACRANKSVIAYNSRTGQLCRVYPVSGKIYDVSYSPNGDYVAFGGTKGDIQVWGAKSGSFLAKFQGLGCDSIYDGTHFLPDNQTLVTRSYGEPLFLRNIRDVLRVR